MATQKKKTIRKVKKNIPMGIVHIHASFNNTIVTITDMAGNAISWASAGVLNFKGSKKTTNYAAQMVCDAAVKKARENGMIRAEIKVTGIGPGRDSAIRQVPIAGLEVSSITDVTRPPHNGCKPEKKARK
jgi:small subunit ribosomal protein S11